MSNKKEISIIVPVFNEEQLIKKFLNDLTNVCKDINSLWEIVVVENGSTDNTWGILKQFSEKDKRIKVVKLPDPSYGLALISGVQASMGSLIVVFNADYWDIRFLKLATIDMLGYDIISASKLLPGSSDLRPFGRRVTTYLYSKFLKYLFGYRGTDTHGIKLLRSKTVKPVINRCRTKSGIFDSEFVIRAEREGLKILELPIEVRELRPARFKISRILSTPVDIFNLWKALR